jgi:serine protease AprX
MKTCKQIGILLVVLLGNYKLQAQFTKYIVKFTNKNGTPFGLANPDAYLSAKAIARRTKQRIVIDSADLPITPRYIDSIRLIPNVILLNRSKWLNQVLIQTSDAAALAKINSFGFVQNVKGIAARQLPTGRSASANKLNVILEPLSTNSTEQTLQTTNINYGNGTQQIKMHNGDYLHNLGFTGGGMSIAVMDAGFFSFLNNSGLDSVRNANQIKETWDFVANEAAVNEDDGHGFLCFSTIAANKPGEMVGTAPKSNYYLYRTEDVSSEYPIEEQNWAAAAERADSIGVDVLTTSLGYLDFDNPAFNYTYAQRNGNFALMTIASDLAAKKGMIVVNSAGNNGNAGGDGKFIAVPADADSILAVGACNKDSIMANFSAWGPSASGKVKPNVAARGIGTTVLNFSGMAVSGNGTSFSAPIIAGLVTCLWQAFPEFTNMQIIDAVQRSAHKYNSPDDRFGYGIPDFKKAYDILLAQRPPTPSPTGPNYQAILGNSWIKVFPNPFINEINIVVKAEVSGNLRVVLFDALGRQLRQFEYSTTANTYYNFKPSQFQALPAGMYNLQILHGTKNVSFKLVK